MSPWLRYGNFFDEINFTTSNEDVGSERRALGIRPGERVLCITASGSRPLELLDGDPGEVVALDYNPLQNHLLQLVMAAASRLSHPEYLAFLGVTEDSQRLATFAALRGDLDEEARAFWDGQESRLAAGVVYSGRWERLLRRGNKYRRRRARKLMAATTLDEQRRIWDEVWATRWWRLRQRIFGRRWLWKHVLREPGYDHIPADFDVPQYLIERFSGAAQRFLLRESPLAWLIYLGRYDAGEALPPYLDGGYFPTLRARLGAIRWQTDGLGEYLAGDVGRFDAFSVSDFASYADEESYRRVWQGIVASAAPGARVCERQFLVKRDPLDFVGERLLRDRELEESLADEDRSMVYTFVAGTIQ